MGQLEEAVTSIERALTHNPELPRYAPILSAAYAHLGRDQKAQAALDDYKKAWEMRGFNLQKAMLFFPFKEPEVVDRLADGLLKAGLLGQPSGYYKIFQKNKLAVEEIRELVFGRRVTGFSRRGGKYWVERTKDGKATYRVTRGTPDDYDDSGTSWIEDDMLCDQWQTHRYGFKHCMTVFRNPEGTPKRKNEYLAISDFGIHPFSLAD
jgi:tetratricopeptide (TPR) repeat protein